MRFRLYREYGALNSAPVFNAFEQGIKSLGHEIVQNHEEVAVIWSVLWAGRMRPNKDVYRRCKENNIPVIIIEVGNLLRGRSWRICLDNINGLGTFGNDHDLDPKRIDRFGIKLHPEKTNRKSEILIASQHHSSLQWEGMPTMAQWVERTVTKLKNYTDRKIIIRPHPRCTFSLNLNNSTIEYPRIIQGSYDDFDIDYGYHCVINHNSGPAVQASIHGVPVICDASSLAGELSNKIENIESVTVPNRNEWFLKLCHTEWTIDEIAHGTPLRRLLTKIS
jgi:hypothetical protein